MTNREKRDQKIVKALRRNPDPELVAGKVGVHVSTIYRAINRTGVELDLLRAINDRPAGAEKACYDYLLNNDISKSEIARGFGVSVSYVSQMTTSKQVA